jgi:hypothetical protein
MLVLNATYSSIISNVDGGPNHSTKTELGTGNTGDLSYRVTKGEYGLEVNVESDKAHQVNSSIQL